MHIHTCTCNLGFSILPKDTLTHGLQESEIEPLTQWWWTTHSMSWASAAPKSLSSFVSEPVDIHRLCHSAMTERSKPPISLNVCFCHIEYRTQVLWGLLLKVFCFFFFQKVETLPAYFWFNVLLPEGINYSSVTLAKLAVKGYSSNLLWHLHKIGESTKDSKFKV